MIKTMFDRLDELTSEGWDFIATWFTLGVTGCFAGVVIAVMVLFSPLLLILTGIGWLREKYWDRKAKRNLDQPGGVR